MKQVRILNQLTGKVKTVDFATRKQAYDYFVVWCDEHGYNYEPDSNTAGGIGHDYLIEILQAQ